jgi:hypothetical protein
MISSHCNVRLGHLVVRCMGFITVRCGIYYRLAVSLRKSTYLFGGWHDLANTYGVLSGNSAFKYAISNGRLYGSTYVLFEKLFS